MESLGDRTHSTGNPNDGPPNNSQKFATLICGAPIQFIKSYEIFLFGTGVRNLHRRFRAGYDGKYKSAPAAKAWRGGRPGAYVNEIVERVCFGNDSQLISRLVRLVGVKRQSMRNNSGEFIESIELNKESDNLRRPDSLLTILFASYRSLGHTGLNGWQALMPSRMLCGGSHGIYPDKDKTAEQILFLAIV